MLLEPETVMLPDWVEMISSQVAHTTKVQEATSDYVTFVGCDSLQNDK